MSDMHSDGRALAREWRAAILVVVGGFAIAILVAAYFLLAKPAVTPQAAAPEAGTPATQAQENRQEAQLAAVQEVCRLELASAKNFGLIPAFGRLNDPNPKATSVQGRYSCLAATASTQYTITGDLICRNLKDARCLVLYSVTQGDGSVLYQRQD